MLLFTSMANLKPIQFKALSNFANTVAAAWFSAGVVSPFFTKSDSLIQSLMGPLMGILMTWIMLRWSLFLLEDIYD